MSDAILKTALTDAMKAAMKAKESTRLSTIRMALAAVKQKEVDERIVLTDQQIIDVLNKMVKQRIDAAEQYQAAGRQELADKERLEQTYLTAFLPQQLTDAELEQLINTTITHFGDTVTMRDMGKIMTELKQKIAGRADMGQVSQKIKAIIAK